MGETAKVLVASKDQYTKRGNRKAQGVFRCRFPRRGSSASLCCSVPQGCFQFWQRPEHPLIVRPFPSPRLTNPLPVRGARKSPCFPVDVSGGCKRSTST